MKARTLAVATAAVAIVALAAIFLWSRTMGPENDAIRKSRDHFVCAGIGYIDFGVANDAPSYYFIDATRTVISTCGFWYRTPMLCPPPGWTALSCDLKYEDWSWKPPLDEAARDAWQRPAEVIAALKLAPDATIASIRGERGYFPVRLARAVPRGRVFVVDYGPEMLRDIARRARYEKLENIVPIDGGDRNPELPAAVDLVAMLDDHTHIDGQREAYFRKLRGLLKPGGRVAIIDFLPGANPMARGVRPGAEQTKREFANAGYALAEEHAFLPRQYFLIFRVGTP